MAVHSGHLQPINYAAPLDAASLIAEVAVRARLLFTHKSICHWKGIGIGSARCSWVASSRMHTDISHSDSPACACNPFPPHTLRARRWGSLPSGTRSRAHRYGWVHGCVVEGPSAQAPGAGRPQLSAHVDCAAHRPTRQPTPHTPK